MLKTYRVLPLPFFIILALLLVSCVAGAPPAPAEDTGAGAAQPAAEEAAAEPTEVPQQTEGAITLTWGMWREK